VLIIVGTLVTLVCVFGGYAMEGGHLGALMQPVEVLMIAGAGLGAFLLGSPIFTQYPKILADHHIVEFLTDYLRLMVGGNMNAFEIESLMDEEIETHHAEGEAPAHALSKVGDAMPAFGIVAAVMGVVHTMASADKPPAVLGEMIAQALVGTFLGILLSYGLIGPLASLAEQRVTESTKMFQCIKVTILASLNGYAPAIAVEFGRKVLFSTERPSFSELEEHVRRVKAK
jgi:chemotaxis protein MotA